MKKRLFVAIPLSGYFKKILSEYSKNYRVEGVRWTIPENLHITLYFIGYVEEKIVPKIITALKDLFSKVKPFDLEFEKISIAPPGGPSRMIWAMFKDKGEYKELTDAVYNAMRDFSTQNFRGKEAIAHVTLARFNSPQIAKNLTIKQPLVESTTMEVAACILVESQLSRSGPRYAILEEFSL